MSEEFESSSEQPRSRSHFASILILGIAAFLKQDNRVSGNCESSIKTLAFVHRLLLARVRLSDTVSTTTKANLQNKARDAGSTALGILRGRTPCAADGRWRLPD
jgi:hypothetical protein